MDVKFELRTWGGPRAPESPTDDAGWDTWTAEHRAWRLHMDELLRAAVFALDEQVLACPLPADECQVCTRAIEARVMIREALSPTGKALSDLVRTTIELVEGASA